MPPISVSAAIAMWILDGNIQIKQQISVLKNKSFWSYISNFHAKFSCCLGTIGYKLLKMSMIPKAKKENGYGEQKSSSIPKKEKKNGYGKQKAYSIPKKAKVNGYIKRKVRYIPKRKDFSIIEIHFIQRYYKENKIK